MQVNSENRIKIDILFWLEQEKDLKTVFKDDVSTERYFLNEKLRYFSEIRDRYKDTASPSEKIFLNTLAGDIKKLEKILYPNFIVRQLARLDKWLKEVSIEKKELRIAQNRNKPQPLTFNEQKINNAVQSSAKEVKQVQKPATTQRQSIPNGEPAKPEVSRHQLKFGSLNNESPERKHRHRLQ